MTGPGRGLGMIALVFVLAQAAWGAETVRITAERVDIHADPNASSSVLATVSRGLVLEVLGRDSGWIRVATPGTGYAGYIPAVLTEPGGGAAPSVTVPATGRSAPAPRTQPPAPAPVAPAAPAPTSTPPPAPTYSPPPPPPPTDEGTVTMIDMSGRSQLREGFWIGFGFGYGSANITCDGCEVDREGSVTGFIKLGGTLNSQILLGVESNAWVKTVGDVRWTVGNLSGTVTFYPQPSTGFFVKGGLGFSYVSAEMLVGGARLTYDETGWGFLTGVGYDLRVGRNTSITPAFNFYYGGIGDANVGVLTIPGVRHDVVEVSVGITFH